jgi:hypothetical protein
VLVELFPRIHARFSSLPLLGPHVDDFVIWLQARGHARLPIYRRIREAPRIDKGLRRRGVRSLDQVSRVQLLRLAPQDSQDDIYLAALVRSLADYLDEQGALADPEKTATQELVDAYRDHLDRVRGFAKMTLAHHASSAAEFLAFLDYEAEPGVLRRLKPRQLEAFIKAVAPASVAKAFSTRSHISGRSCDFSWDATRSLTDSVQRSTRRACTEASASRALYRGRPCRHSWQRSTARHRWADETTRCSC